MGFWPLNQGVSDPRQSEAHDRGDDPGQIPVKDDTENTLSSRTSASPLVADGIDPQAIHLNPYPIYYRLRADSRAAFAWDHERSNH
jgi:hypothetical protein